MGHLASQTYPAIQEDGCSHIDLSLLSHYFLTPNDSLVFKFLSILTLIIGSDSAATAIYTFTTLWEKKCFLK